MVCEPNDNNYSFSFFPRKQLFLTCSKFPSPIFFFSPLPSVTVKLLCEKGFIFVVVSVECFPFRCVVCYCCIISSLWQWKYYAHKWKYYFTHEMRARFNLPKCVPGITTLSFFSNKLLSSKKWSTLKPSSSWMVLFQLNITQDFAPKFHRAFS